MFINTKNFYIKTYKKIPESKKISNFKNKEKGACYIFGDGPSVKYYDLSLFSDLPTIALANISLHTSAKFLNLKYSLSCDSFSIFPQRKYYDLWRMVKAFLSINKNSSDISYHSRQYSNALNLIKPNTLLNLMSTNYLKLLLKDNSTIAGTNFITHCSNYFFSKSLDYAYYYNYNLNLNEDIENYLNKFFFNPYKGSLNFAIYLAIFLGFEKVYLVGCDYQDLEPKIGHWYGKGDGKDKKFIEKRNDFITIMRKFIEIKVITKNQSFGDNFISYKDFTGKELAYKENYEIMKKEKLKEISKLYPWGDF